VHTLVVAGLAVATFASLYVNSHFWWQILVASYAPYWLPLIAVILPFELVRWVRQRSALFFGAGIVVVLAAVLVRGIFLLLPELADGRTAEDTPRGVLRVMFGEAPSTQLEVGAVELSVRAHEVDLFVASGAVASGAVASGAGHPPNDQTFLAASHPYRLKRGSTGQSLLEVSSRLPWDSNSVLDLGEYALPAALLRIPFGEGSYCWIGILSLYAGTSQEQFEVNKVTVRRMASFVKNLSEPVIVLADLQSSTFSRFYTMFSEQIKLKGLFEGRGLLFKSETGRSIFTPMLQRHILVGRKVEIVGAKILNESRPRTLLIHAQARRVDQGERGVQR
jgi:hypothetical protein